MIGMVPLGGTMSRKRVAAAMDLPLCEAPRAPEKGQPPLHFDMVVGTDQWRKEGLFEDVIGDLELPGGRRPRQKCESGITCAAAGFSLQAREFPPELTGGISTPAASRG